MVCVAVGNDLRRQRHRDLLVTDIGRVLCLPVQDDCLPLMGRLAQGPMTMRCLPEAKAWWEPGSTLAGGSRPAGGGAAATAP